MDRIINDEMTLEFRREDGVEGWRIYMLEDHPSKGLVDEEGGTVAHYSLIDGRSWVGKNVNVGLHAKVYNSTILSLNLSNIYGSITDCNIIAKEILIGSGCYVKGIHAMSSDYTLAVDSFIVSDSAVFGSPIWIAPKSDNERYNVEFLNSQVDGKFLINKSLFSARSSLMGEFSVINPSTIVDSSLTGAYILKRKSKIIKNEFSNQDEIIL